MNSYKKWIISLSCSLGAGFLGPATAQELLTETVGEHNIIVGVRASTNNKYAFAYSTDNGQTFSPAKAPTLCGGAPFPAVKYVGNYFLAAGKNGHLCYSRDGKSWKLSPSDAANPKGYSLYDVAYGSTEKAGNVFVAVGQYNTLLYSNDLTKPWQAVPKISGTGWLGLNSVTFAQDKGLFVAVGDAGKTWYSTDGVSWSPGHPQLVINTDYRRVIYANGLFVTVGSYGDIWNSSDGMNWTHVGGNDKYNSLNDIIYSSTNGAGDKIGDNQFIAVGDNSEIWSSKNGSDWSQVPLHTHDKKVNFKSVVSGGLNGLNRMFIAVGSKGNIWISGGGNTTWYGSYGPDSTSTEFIDVIYNGKSYVALGADGTTAYSTRGDNWIGVPIPN
jgi:hypothetical protein